MPTVLLYFYKSTNKKGRVCGIFEKVVERPLKGITQPPFLLKILGVVFAPARGL